jgi:hypothetical protein
MAAIRSAIFLSCLLPVLAAATTWTFGSDFSIQWSDGYKHLVDNDGASWVNSQGIGVTIDVLGHGQMDKATEQAQINKWSDYAHGKFVAIAARHGEIVLPLKQERLPSGSLLYWIGVDGHHGLSEHFGLLYLDISPHGRLAQFVVEGPGLAEDHAKEFRDVFKTEHWHEQ